MVCQGYVVFIFQFVCSFCRYVCLSVSQHLCQSFVFKFLRTINIFQAIRLILFIFGMMMDMV